MEYLIITLYPEESGWLSHLLLAEIGRPLDKVGDIEVQIAIKERQKELYRRLVGKKR